MNPNGIQEVEIVVQRGYHPNRTRLAAGAPARITFLRQEAGACSREVVFPALGIRRELPQGVPVTIEVPALAAVDLAFTCGMNMMRGSLAVEPA